MRNFVVLHIGAEPWTLAGLLVAGAGVGFVIWLAFLLVFAPRWGKVRMLDASEAAQVAINPAETGYVDRLVPIHGPARGVETKVEFTIGTLREAWKARDYARFFGLPALVFAFAAIFEALLLAMYLSVGERFWLLFGMPNLVVAPILLSPIFAMWAAVYTKLE